MLTHLLIGTGLASFAIGLVILFRLVAQKNTLWKGIKSFLLVMFFQSLGVASFSLGVLLLQHQILTREIPVAFVQVEKLDMPKTTRLTFTFPDQEGSKVFKLTGDQWVVEADIINWASWLDIVGLAPYYRLTRVRGRYNRIIEEQELPGSVFSLNGEEDNSFWQFLYEFGASLPLIDTVYGTAVIQNATNGNRFAIYVSSDGLLTRKQGS